MIDNNEPPGERASHARQDAPGETPGTAGIRSPRGTTTDSTTTGATAGTTAGTTTGATADPPLLRAGQPRPVRPHGALGAHLIGWTGRAD
ncbi:hypothetical protein [Streptomyces griseoloalbus]|uniref:Uncharacterized protein n=1 Tax=Streptomyces griseoloalbus TaxID=67303 RepID=A0A7W8FAY1_9ACTN|nr:hypothetical protein [Streptomyces albaduncus]MBB5129693.1 hypothetical protein [Streptomyces albaduncus]GGW63083.1 hypothetical protein GCM10010340_46880 [Streptomyces albaduncus]